jgi:hypothetical protein
MILWLEKTVRKKSRGHESIPWETVRTGQYSRHKNNQHNMPQAHTRYPAKSAVTRVVECRIVSWCRKKRKKRNSNRNRTRSHVVKSEEKPGIVLRGEEDCPSTPMMAILSEFITQ